MNVSSTTLTLLNKVIKEIESDLETNDLKRYGSKENAEEELASLKETRDQLAEVEAELEKVRNECELSL